MNTIIQILVERDGLSEEEATALYEEVVGMVNIAVANGNYEAAEDIVIQELGLEPDYLIDMF